MRPKYFVIGGFVVLVVALVGVVGWFMLRNELVIENRSGRDTLVVTVEVTGGGSTHVYPTIPDGEIVRTRFTVGSDGGIVVRGEFADGDMFTTSGGYVSGSMHGERVMITIEPDGSASITLR